MKKLTIKNKNSKQIYKRLIITYTCVILGIVLVLEGYLIMSIQKERRTRDLEYNQEMCQEAANYTERIANIAADVQYGLYQNKTQIEDAVWFLTLDLEGYFRKKFEEYSKNNNYVYQGMDYFAKDAFRYSSNMTHITFVSFSSNKMYTYYPNGDTKTDVCSYDAKLDKDFNIQIKDGNITFNKEIFDPDTFQEIGSLKISFNMKGFSDLEGNYGESKLLIFLDNKGTLYSSEKEAWINELKKNDDITVLEKKHHIYINKVRTRELNIITYVDKGKTGEIPILVWIMLLWMGIGLFLIGMYFVNKKILHLSNRLEVILKGMERVMGGDLSVRLEVKKEDELDIIAENFNIMCENLDTYIEKSYLAEIEQKNAEMSALQSQINPHFLYNTLEAIRMKAICNGDKEVGKMLYGLAVVFRSQIKDDNIVNVAKELYYCKKYLELFVFRYQNKFQFTIDCPEEYAVMPVIKFIVQPIIENYFAHGIRLQEDDNFLEIKVQRNNNNLLIHVKDNGIGMTEDEIIKKQEEMKEKISKTGSIGLLNVHRRMVAAYGDNYGIELRKNQQQGLWVTLKIPLEE